MNIDNDQFLNELLDEEYRKIPSLFKLSKITARIATAAIGVFFVLSMMFIVFFYNSGSNEMMPQGDNAYSMSIDLYNNEFIKYAVLCLAVVIVIAFWLFMVQYYEKRAYAKASDFASRIHHVEMQKKEEKLQQETYAFRPVKSQANDPAFWTVKKSIK